MTAQHPRSQIIFNALGANLPKAIVYLTSTGSLLFGHGAQFVGFVVLARYLGAEQFGRVMAITAMTAIALSISGLGTEEVMLRRCIREPTLYPKLLGHSVILILISGVFLSLLTVVGVHMLVRVTSSSLRNIQIIAIFAFANIVLARWIVLTEYIFIAKKQITYANIVFTGFAVIRALAAIVGCLIFGVDSLDSWALWYGGSHIVGTLACVAALWKYGAPQWCVLRDEVRRGIQLDTSQLVINLNQNINRIVLAAVVTPVTVGAYSVASNIVRLSLVTINSFSRLFYPKLAAVGLTGVAATSGLAVRYLPIIVGIGVTDSVVLFSAAPLLTWLFGNQFSVSVHYLSVLCWLPIPVAIQNIAFDALGAAEKHGMRALFYNITGVLAVGLIAGLTYLYGIYGAFAGIFTSQVVMCVVIWALLIVLGERENKLTYSVPPHKSKQ